MNLEDTLLKAIDNRIKLKIDELKFDKTYYGRVVNIDTKTCVVEINQSNYNCRIRDGLTLLAGDVVLVKSPNNNFSFLYVDGKLI